MVARTRGKHCEVSCILFYDHFNAGNFKKLHPETKYFMNLLCAAPRHTTQGCPAPPAPLCTWQRCKHQGRTRCIHSPSTVLWEAKMGTGHGPGNRLFKGFIFSLLMVCRLSRHCLSCQQSCCHSPQLSAYLVAFETLVRSSRLFTDV